VRNFTSRLVVGFAGFPGRRARGRYRYDARDDVYEGTAHEVDPPELPR
jgi:hypothetical protein